METVFENITIFFIKTKDYSDKGLEGTVVNRA